MRQRQWLAQGPKLIVSTLANARDEMGRDPRSYLAFVVTNRGNAPTTLTNIMLCNYPTRWGVWLRRAPEPVQRWAQARWTAIVTRTDMPLPYLLSPGQNWQGKVAHTPPGLKVMIDGGRLFVAAIASHTDKPILQRVRQWKPPKNAKEIQ
jgi:hypothetical protein